MHHAHTVRTNDQANEYTHDNLDIHTYMYTHARKCTHTNARMHAKTNIYTNKQTNKKININKQTNTHTHITDTSYLSPFLKLLLNEILTERLPIIT